MRIIYDDIVELAEVVIRCDNTERERKCAYCPFFERCDKSEFETRLVFCGEIKGAEEKGGASDA